MDTAHLVVSLPGEPSRRDMLLAAVSLPEQHVPGMDIDVNLDESRSESSKSSGIEHSLATGCGPAASSCSEPSPEDVMDDELSPSDEGSTGSRSQGAGVMKRAWQPEEDELLLKLVQFRFYHTPEDLVRVVTPLVASLDKRDPLHDEATQIAEPSGLEVLHAQAHIIQAPS